VIPLAPEPIINEDGHSKSDCERNATRRWLKSFRRDHPHLPVIVLKDALSSNAPRLDDLRETNAHYIIGGKPGDHAFLFRFLAAADKAGRTETLRSRFEEFVRLDDGVAHVSGVWHRPTAAGVPEFIVEPAATPTEIPLILRR